MGAEQSTYDGPPEILEARDISSVAKYMKSGQCKNIVVMLGAGVSTSAGIPDFRSPDTGLYANLARLNLPYPEAVFEINFFRENPRPFYQLAHELMPGRFRPTPTHSFVRLLANHEQLYVCFTQNIDTLERRAGVPGELIVEAHGSFASQRCVECKTPFDGEKMEQHIREKKIPVCESCHGLVKPDIVFFGESLPPLFHQSIPKLRNADLLFVIGTSLTVQPFASLARMVPENCPRVLINLDHVGDFGSRPDDVVLLGKCDEVIRDLCRELGWQDELDKTWKETEDSVVEFQEVKEPEEVSQARHEKARAELAAVAQGQPIDPEKLRLKEEVDELTDQVARSLDISGLAQEAQNDGAMEAATGEELPLMGDQQDVPDKSDGDSERADIAKKLL